MKGNIKKLAVFVMIGAIAMFIGAAMASARDSAGDQKGRKSIQGVYAFTGSGGCLIAPFGFDDKLQPKEGIWSGPGPNVWAGVYTFEHDGTGTMTAYNGAISPPDSFPPDSLPSALSAEISWAFDYTVTNSGKITFKNFRDFKAVYTSGPNAGLIGYLTMTDEYYGMISPDGKMINAAYGPPLKHYLLDGYNGNIIPGPEFICQVAIVGFRQW